MIKKRVDNPPIGPILEYYGAVKLPIRESWASMRCPFHDDTHSSATVSLREGVFCCFACQIKGNAYTIVMKREGVNFVEALKITERILDQSGEVLPQFDSRSRGLSGRKGNKSGGGSYGTVGRRFRSSHGA